ncbi:MAG: AAA family ATPase [Parcubacteria group bacterium]
MGKKIIREPPMIIGLTGPLAAGKGTIVKYLVENYQARQVRFSDPLRDIIHRLYKDQTRENMSHLATFLRSEFGGNILIDTVLEDIKKMDGSLFVLDGMRHIDEYRILSERHDFRMWAVDADMKTRYERIIKRGENASDTTLTYDRFQKQHELITEVHISELMAKAHEHIDNNGSFEDLYAQVEVLMKKLK